MDTNDIEFIFENQNLREVCAEKTARITALEADLANALGRVDAEQTIYSAKITALEAENAKLKAALKPFADIRYLKLDPSDRDYFDRDSFDRADVDGGWAPLKALDIRNAAAALKEPTNAELDLIAPF